MASGPHTFTILGVFSPEQYHGNRLAVVAVRGNVLSRQKKALIAKEFGYTGTVFIHDAAGPGIPRRLEIFNEQGEELAFSGHSVLGTAHHVFQYCETEASTNNDKPLTTVLMSKAGPVPVLYNAQRQVAACSIPHAYHLHTAKLSFERVLDVQPQLQIVPTITKCKDKAFPVVSIVKGMTFCLVDLTETPEVLGALQASKTPEMELDEDWSSGFKGALFYKKKDSMVQAGEPTIHSIQTRVIDNGIEDAGTGSACSALACYLAMHEDVTTDAKAPTDEKAPKEASPSTNDSSTESRNPSIHRHVYAIQQGVEMGRACTIAIEIDLVLGSDGTKTVKNITLSGKANFFARGELVKP